MVGITRGSLHCARIQLLLSAPAPVSSTFAAVPAACASDVGLHEATINQDTLPLATQVTEANLLKCISPPDIAALALPAK